MPNATGLGPDALDKRASQSAAYDHHIHRHQKAGQQQRRSYVLRDGGQAGSICQQYPNLAILGPIAEIGLALIATSEEVGHLRVFSVCGLSGLYAAKMQPIVVGHHYTFVGTIELELFQFVSRRILSLLIPVQDLHFDNARVQGDLLCERFAGTAVCFACQPFCLL
jgi:hypothetical protein